MRKYEAMFILNPKLEEEKQSKEIDKLKDFITKNDAEVVKVESLGKKKLSYPIKKLKEGDYVVFEFSSEPTLIDKIKEEIKHNQSILRSMFLVLEKEK